MDFVKYVPTGLKHCVCIAGDPRLSAIRDALAWCTCDPATTFLAALELAIKANTTPFTLESYAKCHVYVRTSIRALTL